MRYFSKVGWAGILVAGAVLHSAAVKKAEDPIVNTQTNPIAHKQKVEETKDGEKAAPAPTFDHYQEENFHIQPPLEEFKTPEKDRWLSVPYLGEPIPEDIGEEEEEADTEDWWEPEEGEEAPEEEGAGEEI